MRYPEPDNWNNILLAFFKKYDTIKATKLWRCFLMAYKISDSCISCGACAAGCPCDAISEGAEHYEIDADKCCSCGACAAGCPVEAIAEE